MLLNNMVNPSDIGFKSCIEQFEPKVKPFLKVVGINIETTRNFGEGEDDVPLNDIFTHEGVSIIFNGHMYNTPELVLWSGEDMAGKNEFELILILYIKYGIEYTVSMIDGKFSFIIIDQRTSVSESHIYVVQDALGTQPLYMLKNTNAGNGNHGCHHHEANRNTENNTNVFAVSSDIKNLDKTLQFLNIAREIEPRRGAVHFTSAAYSGSESQVQPHYDISRVASGSYLQFVMPMQVSAKWRMVGDPVIYNRLSRYSDVPKGVHLDDYRGTARTLDDIQCHFVHAIKKRCDSALSTISISCIVNGSSESFLVASLVAEYCRKKNRPMTRTYSIRYSNQTRDVERIAVIVKHINTVHTEIIIPDDEGLGLPARVQEDIAYCLLGKRISDDCADSGYESDGNETKTVFCTLGAKSVLYGGDAVSSKKNPLEFDISCRKSLSEVVEVSAVSAYKNMESDNNIQCVFPFLDNAFIQNYFAISPETRMYYLGKNQEWNILKFAFAPDSNYRHANGKEIIPYDFSRSAKINGVSLCESISKYPGDIVSL